MSTQGDPLQEYGRFENFTANCCDPSHGEAVQRSSDGRVGTVVESCTHYYRVRLGGLDREIIEVERFSRAWWRKFTEGP